MGRVCGFTCPDSPLSQISINSKVKRWMDVLEENSPAIKNLHWAGKPVCSWKLLTWDHHSNEWFLRFPLCADDFESKFTFHSMEDFPPPDEYKPCQKIYPSKIPRSKYHPYMGAHSFPWPSELGAWVCGTDRTHEAIQTNSEYLPAGLGGWCGTKKEQKELVSGRDKVISQGKWMCLWGCKGKGDLDQVEQGYSRSEAEGKVRSGNLLCRSSEPYPKPGISKYFL